MRLLKGLGHITFFLLAIILTAAIAKADVIPRLGPSQFLDNTPNDPLRRAAPAVSDEYVDEDGNRRFAVSWLRRVGGMDSVMVVVVDEFGETVSGPSSLANYAEGYRVSNPALAIDSRGYLHVTWSAITSFSGLDFDQSVFSRTLSFVPDIENDRAICPTDGVSLDQPGLEAPALATTVGIADLDDTAGNYNRHNGPLTVAMDTSASGRALIVFPDHRSEPYWGLWAIQSTMTINPSVPEDQRTCGQEYAWLEPDRGMFRITGSAEARAVPSVALNENNDRAVVTWRSQTGPIEAQRLDQAGNLIGDRIIVAERPGSAAESLHDPVVDYAENDAFRVVWERSSYGLFFQDRLPFSEILMSTYSDDGTLISDQIVVASEIGDDYRDAPNLRYPVVQTRDLDGDFAIGWSQQAAACPSENANWFVRAFDGCSGGGTILEAGILLLPGASSCTLQLYDLASSGLDQCRVQLELRPFADDIPVPASWSLAPDDQWGWDDYGGGGTRNVELVWGAPHPSLNRCARLEYSFAFGPREYRLEQFCSAENPANCMTCSEQQQALGLESPASVDSDPHMGASQDEDFGPGQDQARDGVVGSHALRLRWFQSDWQASEASEVETITVNFPGDPLTGISNGRAALGMGRDSEMMFGWISNFSPAPGLATAVPLVQGLAGPVELSINDVGILEGPLGRATANFTLSANKRYPFKPGDCIDGVDVPRPAVSLLTANDSATFQTDDYVRTTENLQFADQCGPPAEYEDQLSFSVEVLDDEVYENVESFFVDLFNETNAIVVRRQGIGAIVDNDSPSTVQPPGEIIYVCEDGNQPDVDDQTDPVTRTCPKGLPPIGFVEVPVVLSAPQEVEGSVEFITADGEALGPIGSAQSGIENDYEAVTGELQFLSGNDRAFLSIDLYDDEFAELTEEFRIQLTGADNLVLPEGEVGNREITVRILDTDECQIAPTWVLPDGDATPGASPPNLPQDGTVEELTGYVCVINPDGYDDCPWASRLDLNEGQDGFWLSRKDIPFDSIQLPDPPTADEVADARQACSGVSDPNLNGAIRYTALKNLPSGDPDDPPPLSRSGEILFINGSPVPQRRTVTQEGSGACLANVEPQFLEALPVGGEFTFSVDFGGVQGCEFNQWTAALTQGQDWLTIEDVSTTAGDGEVVISVDPYLIDATPPNGMIIDPREGTLRVAEVDISIFQEAPLFDHFDDELLPPSSQWSYTAPAAWSEAGTHLTADTDSQARLIATPVFPGCSVCALDTSLRFDEFSKGRITIYLWWQGEDDHLRLVADEFFDRWSLTQRIGGEDHELRSFTSDIEVGVEYPVQFEFRDDLGVPLITVNIAGQGMCTVPQSGGNVCLPYDADPDPEVFDYVIGEGTVGFAVEETRGSFNRLRVIRADRAAIVADRVFEDRFDAP